MTSRTVWHYAPTAPGDFDDLAVQVAQLRNRLDEMDLMLRNHGKEHSTVTGSDPTKYHWRRYTPTLTASITDPVLGTNGSAEGRWLRDGLEVIVTFRILFGTAGVSAGSGTYRITLPTAYNDGLYTASAWSLGMARLVDSSSTDTTAIVTPSGATNKSVILFTTGSAPVSVTASNPWTWAANDAIAGTFTYMADKG